MNCRSKKRLRHANDVDMLYRHRLQDMERNLSSAGFFERRKMQKEIAKIEEKRSDFYQENKVLYGTTAQLEKQRDKLVNEKIRIENATGVTAERNRVSQEKRDAVIQQRESRERYDAERRAKRLVNPSRDKDEASL